MKTEGWEIRLSQYLESCASRPFSWGSFDCCQFANEALEATTGRNFMREMRTCYLGGYSTQEEAAALIKETDGTFLKAGRAVAAFYGVQEVPKGLLQRGDLCIVENVNMGFEKAFAIVSMNPMFATLPAAGGGLELVPIDRVVKGWGF